LSSHVQSAEKSDDNKRREINRQSGEYHNESGGKKLLQELDGGCAFPDNPNIRCIRVHYSRLFCGQVSPLQYSPRNVELFGTSLHFLDAASILASLLLELVCRIMRTPQHASAWP
jgi:hypothetical protein